MARNGPRRSAQAEAEFRRLVDEAKERHNISDVVARVSKVRRVGREHVALCLFHQERTPSLQLNDTKGTFHCFGCGSSGDIVELVMRLERVDFLGAMRWLGVADLPVVDPADRVRAAAEDDAERRAAIERARGVWEKAVPAANTPAEVYARARGITVALPTSIRFAMTPSWYDDDTGECGPDLPAMIGAVVDGANELIGIQRVFLAEGGRRKAAMNKPKRSLGRIKGGALRLRDLDDATEIVVTEGPEDGLSLYQTLPNRAVWVTLGTALMPEVQYPATVRSIIIAAQNDEAGRVAVEKASGTLLERGLAVCPVFPPPVFKDWNDLLRGAGC